MKKISVIGNPSYELKMFILELAWALSNDEEILCLIEDEFFERFSYGDLNVTTIGNLTLIKSTDLIGKSSPNSRFLVSDILFEDSDYIIYALSQNPFSAKFLDNFSEHGANSEKVLVFLDFLSDSDFDEKYFKRFQLNKQIIDNVSFETVFHYDEDVRRLQLENQMNRLISLKNYPKKRKQKLALLAEHFKAQGSVSYKEYYRELDKRISLC